MIGLLPERETKEVSITTVVVIAIASFTTLVAWGIQALVGAFVLVGVGYGARALYRIIYRRLTRKSREEAARYIQAYNCINYWVRCADGTLKANGTPLPPYADNIVE